MAEVSGDIFNKFVQVTAKNVDNQVKEFLRAFVLDFKGNFEEILDLADEFKSYAPRAERETFSDLEEHQAHLFLEKRDETLTVKELRDALLIMDYDKNHRVAFVEYALWKYKKTVAEFVSPKVAVDEETLKLLDEAIATHQKVVALRVAREAKEASLQALIDADPNSIKGKMAYNELQQMKNTDKLEQNRREISAAAAKRKAEKLVNNDELRMAEQKRKQELAFKEEQKRLDEEKKKKDEEDKQKKEEARARLKAKAAAFEKQ